MKEIRLRFRKCSGLVALIDDEDFGLISQYHWYANWNKGVQTFYVRGFISGKGMSERKIIYMHRLIMDANPNEQVDHIDHNGLNNQKANLRFCNHSQNAANKRKQRGESTSKFKGVSWDERHKKWQAQIKLDSKLIRIDYFDDEIDAAKAYDKKAIELFGDFAMTNKMLGLFEEKNNG